MEHARLGPLRRIALLIAVVAVCTGAGWQTGRLAGPQLPPPGIDVPAGGHGHG